MGEDLEIENTTPYAAGRADWTRDLDMADALHESEARSPMDGPA
ncbi:MAG TPA: hypothetical protein VM694_22880 [Polyangium sp.]|nr:hypothetical protein [Polyangium sp.]